MSYGRGNMKPLAGRARLLAIESLGAVSNFKALKRLTAG